MCSIEDVFYCVFAVVIYALLSIQQQYDSVYTDLDHPKTINFTQRICSAVRLPLCVYLCFASLKITSVNVNCDLNCRLYRKFGSE